MELVARGVMDSHLFLPHMPNGRLGIIDGLLAIWLGRSDSEFDESMVSEYKGYCLLVDFNWLTCQETTGGLRMMAVVYLSGGVALLLVWWLNRTNPPRILKLIWQVDSVVEFSFAALMIANLLLPAFNRRGDWPIFEEMGVLKHGDPPWVVVLDLSVHITAHVLAGLVAASPGVRLWFQSILAARSESVAAVAGVSALIGRDQTVKGILQSAAARFKAMDFNSLRREDITERGIVGADGKMGYPAKLGCVDMFISHSWHDNKELKWLAMSQFRDTFKAEHGRDASIWLDMACIDQTSIEDDLKCLPVFLAGCNRLLIITGETYTRRLWCIMELFVFLQMGGGIEHVDHLVLATTPEEAAQIFSLTSAFDAQDAQCFVPEDRDRLLSLIEAGFGSMRAFNRSVRNIFEQMPEESCMMIGGAGESPTSRRKRSLLEEASGMFEELSESSSKGHGRMKDWQLLPRGSLRQGQVLPGSDRSSLLRHSSSSSTTTTPGKAGEPRPGAVSAARWRLAAASTVAKVNSHDMRPTRSQRMPSQWARSDPGSQRSGPLHIEVPEDVGGAVGEPSVEALPDNNPASPRRYFPHPKLERSATRMASTFLRRYSANSTAPDATLV